MKEHSPEEIAREAFAIQAEEYEKHNFERRMRGRANGPEPVERQRIKLIPFDEIEVGTAPEYVIDGLIPAEGFTVIWGPPKSYKSYIAFDMALHIALGWDYRGRRVQQGSVVYCAFEGQHGFKKRCAAFQLRFLESHSEPVPFHLVPVRLDLIKEVGLLVEAIALDCDEPSLVVLDTLNRSLVGSESRDEDMSAYIAAADQLRHRFKCAVVIVHHCGIEAGRPRGHTSLTGAADAQHAVKRAGKVATLTVEFMKDGEEGASFGSALEVIEIGVDDDGEPITSCVCVPADAIQTEGSGSLSASAKVALNLLRKAIMEAGEVPPASNHIPKNVTGAVPVTLWKRYCKQGMVTDSDKRNSQNTAIRRAAETLQAKGFIGVWGDWVWAR